MATSTANPAPVARAAICRHHPRQEPSAVVPHAGICAGGGQQWPYLPQPRVIGFYLRAITLAYVRQDRWSLRSAVGPREMATLLQAARGRRCIVEIGTGTAWSTIALALADPERRVFSCDPTIRPMRERYLRLAGSARRRIR